VFCFFQAEDGIRDWSVTGVQTCALPIFELAGHERSGIAIGLQQTLLNLPGAAYPALFGVLVATTSWEVAFVGVALFPLVGWRVRSEERRVGKEGGAGWWPEMSRERDRWR